MSSIYHSNSKGVAGNLQNGCVGVHMQPLKSFWMTYPELTPSAPTSGTFIQGDVKRIIFNIATIQSGNSRSGFVALHINGCEATYLTGEQIPTDVQAGHFTAVAKQLIQAGFGHGGGKPRTKSVTMGCS
jgi:hypothetical protein